MAKTFRTKAEISHINNIYKKFMNKNKTCALLILSTSMLYSFQDNIKLSPDVIKRINYSDFDGPSGVKIFNDLPVESLWEFARKLKTVPPTASDRSFFGNVVKKYLQFEDIIEEPLKSEVLNLIKERAYGTGESVGILSQITMWWGTANELAPAKDPEIQNIVIKLREMANNARTEYLIAQGKDPSAILPYGVSPSPTPKITDTNHVPLHPSRNQFPSSNPTPKTTPSPPFTSPNSPVNYLWWGVAFIFCALTATWLYKRSKTTGN